KANQKASTAARGNGLCSTRSSHVHAIAPPFSSGKLAPSCRPSPSMQTTRARLPRMFAVALAFIAPMAMAASQPADVHAALQGKLDALSRRTQPGVFGIVVLDPRSGERWRVNADRAYPMMSVFKAPVAAAVFAQIDSGKLSMERAITLTRADIVGGSAVPSIGAHFHGRRMSFTVRQLLAAAV